ncbi:MAG: UvrD-helicase domain-containing protein [Bdellovibrionota bacterium]
MIDINGLNSEQRSAVVNFSGPTLILAGAGTGKTRVITTRIAYMLRNGVSSKNVAAMTFTNKAAKEMRERVGELIGKSQAKNLSIGTFHSFCINILRQYGSHLGLSKRFTLVGTSDQIDLVRKSLEEKAWSNHFKADSLLYEINQCKNWLISPDDLKKGILPRHSVSDPAILAEVYELYERQLQLNRAIDFDDCIFKVVKLLREFPEIKAKLSEKYRYLLIDEFQDTNSSQFAIIEEMATEHLNVCVVGDDDQSIYSWRGAMYETMEKFKTTFPTTKIIKLEQNYRCTNIILNAANSVIKNNSQRMKKTLWSASSDETPIVIAPSSDAVEEARWVASKCIELLGIGFKPADIAILYRSNSQAKLMEMALRECTVSYKTFGGQSFFERREVKIFLGYLRLVANPDDHLALWRVINSPVRGLGLKSQEKIEANALNFHTSPYAILRDKSNEYFKGKTLQAITELVQHIETLRSLTLKTPEDMAEVRTSNYKEI